MLRAGDLPDRARAHRDHDVAVARERANRRRQLRDVLDEHRLDLAGDADRAGERAPVGGDDRRFARRIDVGEHAARRRSTAPSRNPRTGRACACSGAAGTRARAGGPGSCRARRRSSPPSRPGGGRSRRSACRRRPLPQRARHSAGSGGRRRGIRRAPWRSPRRRRRPRGRPRSRRARSARCARRAG